MPGISQKWPASRLPLFSPRVSGGATQQSLQFSIHSGSEQNPNYENVFIFLGSFYLIQLCLSCLHVCLPDRGCCVLEDWTPLTHLPSHCTEGKLYCSKYSVKFSWIGLNLLLVLKFFLISQLAGNFSILKLRILKLRIKIERKEMRPFQLNTALYYINWKKKKKKSKSRERN